MNEIEGFVSEIVSKYKNSHNENVSFKAENYSLGKCPKCGRNVEETPKAYSCCGGKDGCGFLIWKTISGKKITVNIAEHLIKNKQTKLLKGFISQKTGKEFSAKLVLNDDGKVRFSFEDIS